jgi:hypothetical protein
MMLPKVLNGSWTHVLEMTGTLEAKTLPGEMDI